MSDYISREAVTQKLLRMIGYCTDYSLTKELTVLFQVGDAVIDIPAADVSPVVHARCIVNCDGDTSCSNCGEKWIDPTKNYCPECGARLDLEAVYE